MDQSVIDKVFIKVNMMLVMERRRVRLCVSRMMQIFQGIFPSDYLLISPTATVLKKHMAGQERLQRFKSIDNFHSISSVMKRAAWGQKQ